MKIVQISRASGDLELVERDIPEPGGEHLFERIAAQLYTNTQ